MTHLYVCHFSNGHIKVGRSIDPKARIAAHADRVACLGIELVEHHIAECVGFSQPAEAALIEQCANTATKRNQSEWFEGLDFPTVSQWCGEAAISIFSGQKTKQTADAEFIEKLGGPTKLAEILNYDKKVGGVQRVQNWITRGIPSSVKIEHPEIFLSGAKPVSTREVVSEAP